MDFTVPKLKSASALAGLAGLGWVAWLAFSGLCCGELRTPVRMGAPEWNPELGSLGSLAACQELGFCMDL